MSKNKAQQMIRMFVLTVGTGMDGESIVFKTNAPKNVLKELEKESNKILKETGDFEDIPVWLNVLSKKYIIKYIDSHQHVTAYGTSNNWLKENFKNIKEKYLIG